MLAINEDARNLSVPSFIKGGEEIRKLRTENIDLQAENEQLSKILLPLMIVGIWKVTRICLCLVRLVTVR